jgi:serine protease Do
VNERRGPTLIAVVIVALVVGVVAGVLGGFGYVRLAGPGGAAVGAPQGFYPPGTTVNVSTQDDAIVRAAALAGPAAVKIESTFQPRGVSPWEFLFGPPQPVQGIGSGSVFQFDGHRYVLTNTHVVSTSRGFADDITLYLSDGRKLGGKLVAADRARDVAVVDIANPPSNLPVAELGDSDKLKVGEWVIAIGNPFNFEHTVTVGVVSALNRRMPVGPEERNLIQTDAAINQGNSGGPLVNLAGQVVGINTLIFSPTGTSVGIGFAIPINDAKDTVFFFLRGGPWVGVSLRPNSQAFANAYGLATSKGVVVGGVEAKSPAEAAGLKPLDVVLSVDGKEVSSPEQVQEQVRQHRIGDRIELTIMRGNQQQQVTLVAARLPQQMLTQ